MTIVNTRLMKLEYGYINNLFVMPAGGRKNCPPENGLKVSLPAYGQKVCLSTEGLPIGEWTKNLPSGKGTKSPPDGEWSERRTTGEWTLHPKIRHSVLVVFLIGFSILFLSGCRESQRNILKPETFKHYVDQFNAADTLNLHVDVIPGTRMIRNDSAWSFLKNQIPLFECPDKELEEVYYYRWWTFRKHIKKTAEGYVITEFMPNVPWSGKYNTIPCPAGHHFREGRWLHNPVFIRDYGHFWLQGGGDPFRYSFWIADSYYQLHQVHPDDSLLTSVLPDLVANFREWEKRRRAGDGLFWQYAGQDGMEVGIGGDGKRPTINAYMFADARAIAAIAKIGSKQELADQFSAEAEKIRQLTLNKLWDDQAKFFKVWPWKKENTAENVQPKLSDARELLGYVPWYVELPPKNKGYEAAWKQLMDKKGFFAPYGPTTAEQRHPGFRVSYEGHECQWNGPSWPFATSQTLTALANVLNNYPQNEVSKNDFFETLKIYTQSHRFRQIPPEGDTLTSSSLWIDENLNPYNGDWLARTRMEVQGHNHRFRERGIYYNHSTYNDIIITGLAGLRPAPDNVLIVNPLIPEGRWNYFCLDNLRYHGKIITILYDKTGNHYGKGKGLQVFTDGKKIAGSPSLQRITVKL